MSEAAPLAFPSSPLRGRRLPMSGALLVSAVGHAFLIALFALGAYLSSIHLEPPQKPIAAKLVRLGEKRDPSFLPRKDLAPPPPPKVVEVPGAAPMVIKPKAPGAAATRANPFQTSRSRLSNAFNKLSKPSDAPAGDPDGDPEGDSETAEEGERYFGVVLAKARRNYGVTKTIPLHVLAKLKATVILYIGADGELLRDPEIQLSSGNEQFDQDVLSSLKRAAPFGPPPKHLAQTLRTVGVAIEAIP